jgi:tetratricopeptide (TPR) repeat protein
MSPERWGEIQALFAEVRSLTPEERTGRLAEISGTDPELHRELESLLAAHDRADELLGSFEQLISEPSFEPPMAAGEVGAGEAAGWESTPDPHGLIGRTVSHYEVVELLGAGGMGILYKAIDTQLGRPVALKFLPPQWGLDAKFKERFQREARAVAALDHPNVCTIHEIGETEEGQLFIAMAHYEGETVGEKIARGPLEVKEAVELAEQAASGLEAAHRAGLVHRDIKPANLMVTEEGVLKILDFGLAKTGETALTATGVRLGTPAYMSPEQTRGEEVDPRSDLWSLGVVLYEMLTGQRPFRGSQDSAIIDAIRREEPRPPGELRTGLPNDLGRLVLGLLSKDPDGRYAGAERLLDELSGAYPRRPVTKRRRHVLWQILGSYVVGSWIVLQLAETLTSLLGFPPWFGPAVIVVLAMGLPVLLLTAWAQSVRRARAFGAVESDGFGRLFTWRNAALGGAIMALLLMVGVAGYTAVRALEIGRPATLISQGRLEERTEVVLASFLNETRDTLLGPALERALRIDLGQSPVVRVVDPKRVATMLERMEVAPETKLDLALAREVAFRGRIGAVLAPAISRVGSGYVLSAELFSTDGELLLSARETAADSTEILVGLDRLSKGLRERIGEPLRSIESSPFLVSGQTSNLEALKKFNAAGSVWLTLDPDSLKLVEEAIALDSTFAMAWLIYGSTLMNMGQWARGLEKVTAAFELRDQLNDRERYLIEGFYFANVTEEREKAIQAYERVLAMGLDGTMFGPVVVLNMLGIEYMRLGQFARAEVTFLESIKQDSLLTGAPRYYETHQTNLASARVNLGKYDEARATLLAPVARLEAEGKEMPIRINMNLAQVASAAGDYETAEQHLVALREGAAGDPRLRHLADIGLAPLAALRGRLREAREHLREDLALYEERDLGMRHLNTMLQRASWRLLVQGDTVEALAIVEADLARYPLAEVPAEDRPYHNLVEFFAEAGETDRARALLEELERESRSDPDPDPHPALRGRIALSDGDYEAAVSRFEQADFGSCLVCALSRLALAYDRAGNADSALANYERYVTTPYRNRLFQDQYFLGPIHERLGQLYDERGDQEDALRNYARFVELWGEADPELQPRVRAAQARLEEILAERG